MQIHSDRHATPMPQSGVFGGGTAISSFIHVERKIFSRRVLAPSENLALV
jgi:hypothetical protein